MFQENEFIQTGALPLLGGTCFCKQFFDEDENRTGKVLPSSYPRLIYHKKGGKISQMGKNEFMAVADPGKKGHVTFFDYLRYRLNTKQK